jgi:hypothetical protein
MINENLLERINGPSPARLAAEEWAAILESAEVVREEDTGVAGMLRILDLSGALFVQEQTPDRTILLRRRPNIGEATAFVDARLQTYERMWDG